MCENGSIFEMFVVVFSSEISFHLYRKRNWFPTKDGSLISAVNAANRTIIAHIVFELHNGVHSLLLIIANPYCIPVLLMSVIIFRIYNLEFQV